MMYGFQNMYDYYILGILILIAVAILVASDASKRGYNGAIWAFIVILMPMMGLFIYLIYISISDANNTNMNQNLNFGGNSFNEQTQPAPVAGSSKENVKGIYCTVCGKLNHDNAMYCKYCGNEIY